MRRPGYLRSALALAVVMGLAAMRPGGVRAATTTVIICDESHLRSVVSGAAAGDTVNFGCSGTITLTSGGGGAITLSQDVTIDGSGQAVTISGGGSVQVLVVNTGVSGTLKNLTIANGSVIDADGGGIFNNGTLTVTDSIFSSNRANFTHFFTTRGGGIFNHGTLSVTKSTFSGNTGLEGGGVFNSGLLTVTNSTFSSNLAIAGGGIDNEGTLSVANSTFSGNLSGIANNSTAMLANTILASSTSGNCVGPMADQGGNLADDGSCGFSQSSRNNASSLNLGALAGNGGPTPTIALLPGSAAIDFGTCLQGTDQRGFARPDASEATCDSGAYEFQDSAVAEINDLIGIIDGFGTRQQASLDSQLQAVLADLWANNTAQVCGDLAAFVHHVMAQSGKKLTTAQASKLLTAASDIMKVLGC